MGQSKDDGDAFIEVWSVSDVIESIVELLCVSGVVNLRIAVLGDEGEVKMCQSLNLVKADLSNGKFARICATIADLKKRRETFQIYYRGEPPPAIRSLFHPERWPFYWRH